MNRTAATVDDLTFPSTDPDPACAVCGGPRSRHADHALYRGPLCPAGPSGAVTHYRPRDADAPRLGLAPHPSVPLGPYVRRETGERCEVLGGVYDRAAHRAAVLYQSAPHGGLTSCPADWFFREYDRFSPEPPPVPERPAR